MKVQAKSRLAQENAALRGIVEELTLLANTASDSLHLCRGGFRKCKKERDALKEALHQISLESQSSMGDRANMGRIARDALATLEKP